jgi:hypothetical protein
MTYYKDFIILIEKFNKIASESDTVSSQLITNVLWTCTFIILKPIAVWGFLLSLVFIAFGAVKKGFEKSESDGFRVFSGTVIPVFLFIYINQFDSISQDIIIHLYFIICGLIGFFLINLLNRVSDQILYFALLSLFCSSMVFTIVYVFKKVDKTPAMSMAMGTAFGILLYVLLNGLDQKKPVFSLFKIGYKIISFWKRFIPKKFRAETETSN